jgi:ubiquinone/menaquinone biosynthesis C-methylase UbiE
MADSSYSMQIGDADAERLELLGQFYDPASSAFLEAAGISPGDCVADLGCGHGGVTDRIAALIGDTGQVFAVDSSPDQLRIARSRLAHRHNVTFVQASLEEDPLQGRHVDWVYSRFLLMHVQNLDRTLAAMADMLTEDGALLLEIADVGSLSFSPANPDSDLWRPWWYALGCRRSLSFDVADRITDALSTAGFVIERRDRYQPIASTVEAKLVHALGFEQCAPAYLREVGAAPAQIETHRRYINRVLHDPTVTVALFENIQYIAPAGSEGGSPTSTRAPPTAPR